MIELAGIAAMHRQRRHAAGLGHPGELQGNVLAQLVAFAELHGHRQPHRGHHRLEYRLGQSHVAHQRRALAFAGNLACRTAHVHIYQRDGSRMRRPQP